MKVTIKILKGSKFDNLGIGVDSIIMNENFHDIYEREEVTRSNETRYIAEIKHLGLGTFKLIKDTDSRILSIKVKEQFKKWDEQWENVVEKNKLQENKTASLNLALEKSVDAITKQNEIKNILLYSLENDTVINWETLKDKNKFQIPNPKKKLNTELDKFKVPKSPILKILPPQPFEDNFKPYLSVFDEIFAPIARKKRIIARKQYLSALSSWENEVNEIEKGNAEIIKKYENKLSEIQIERDLVNKKYEELEREWKHQEADFYEIQNKYNSQIDTFKSLYFKHNIDAIIEYCELVLNDSQYPSFIPKKFDLDYNEETKMLLIDYFLPIPEQIPTITEVKYITTKQELKEIHLSESQITKNYDIMIYNITLRTLHELFKADQTNVIDIITFNGWVNTINKATGKKINSCIISIQVKKSEFIEIDLFNVDPKACFKNLKGIGSSKLSGIVAIQPIVQINKNDNRFIESYNVANQINESSNLAAMDWEDFEHLIREIFEKEFSKNGGEVKVTQASKDGGVDAIAFDPDPLRGGKIVIQAKRYTNIVGVSAVRDLYGTVMNEGATKGILVTTADYGSDSYEFARNKPLTLLNGSNLLHLLEQHGYKAKIDIKEAKKTLIKS